MTDEKNGGDVADQNSPTDWHRLLARLLEIVLSPLGIDVQPDVPVMTEPPEADILLLRRTTAQWTAAQRAHLPDGIRDSQASHILLEFKYTQSFNDKALQQALGYDFFYQQAKKLSPQEIQTVLLSAKKPHSSTLTNIGYQPTEYPGVYRSPNPVLQKVLLLSLNELSNEPHNIWVKCFASRKGVKKQVFKYLQSLDLVSIANELKWFINGLMQIWFNAKIGEEQMKIEVTPEDVTELGKQFGDILLANLTIDEVLDRFEPKEVLSHFKPVERLAGLEPIDRLAGLEPEAIEDYLKQLKRQPR